ncbi:hypothetical protein GCM10027403_01480 [Arthrobacter tecti]
MGFRNTMDDAAVRIGGVPIIGEQVSAPFREAAEAGAFLVSAGQDQQGAVALAASVVGWETGAGETRQQSLRCRN